MKGTGGVRMNHSHKREAENCEKVTRAENLYSEHVVQFLALPPPGWVTLGKLFILFESWFSAPFTS